MGRFPGPRDIPWGLAYPRRVCNPRGTFIRTVDHSSYWQGLDAGPRYIFKLKKMWKRITVSVINPAEWHSGKMQCRRQGCDIIGSTDVNIACSRGRFCREEGQGAIKRKHVACASAISSPLFPPSLRTKQVEQQANVSEPLRRYGYLRGLSQEETAK